MTADATEFTVHVEMRDGGATIAVFGELDLATVDSLRNEVQSAVDRGHGDVVLDMSGVTYMDSSGLNVVLNARQMLERSARRLLIAQPSASVTAILTICGLTEIIMPSGDAADSATS